MADGKRVMDDAAIEAGARALCKAEPLILDGFDGLKSYVESFREEKRQAAKRLAKVVISAALASPPPPVDWEKVGREMVRALRNCISAIQYMQPAFDRDLLVLKIEATRAAAVAALQLTDSSNAL